MYLVAEFTLNLVRNRRGHIACGCRDYLELGSKLRGGHIVFGWRVYFEFGSEQKRARCIWLQRLF